VTMQRLDYEPQLSITADEISSIDPFLLDVEMKLEEAAEAIVKTEPEDFPIETFVPETWLFSSAPKVENMKDEEAPVKQRKKQKKTKFAKTPSGAAKIQNTFKPKVFNRAEYEKKVLRGCKVTSCDFMIHPKLVKDHNKIFHPKKVKDQPEPKIPEASPNRELCPYCGKTILTSSAHVHVRSDLVCLGNPLYYSFTAIQTLQ
jgi:hypothetical protein